MLYMEYFNMFCKHVFVIQKSFQWQFNNSKNGWLYLIEIESCRQPKLGQIIVLKDIWYLRLEEIAKFQMQGISGDSDDIFQSNSKRN